MELSLKFVRTVQLILLVSIVVYAFIAQRFGPAPREVVPAFSYAITTVAVALAGAVFVLRQVMVRRAERMLAANAQDARALVLWRMAYVFTFFLCETIALLGITLRFAGSGFSQVVPFFLAGFILMLLFGPRRRSDAIG